MVGSWEEEMRQAQSSQFSYWTGGFACWVDPIETRLKEINAADQAQTKLARHVQIQNKLCT